MSTMFLVEEVRGGERWDWSRGFREQEGWDEHAVYMDALAEDGFVVLGGPLDERNVLLVVEAESEEAIRDRLAADPWIGSGMLAIERIRPWTVLLRRAAHRPESPRG